MWKLWSKKEVKFNVCENCKGNGYITSKSTECYNLTMTCESCNGEGHIKPKNWINDYKNTAEYSNF